MDLSIQNLILVSQTISNLLMIRILLFLAFQISNARSFYSHLHRKCDLVSKKSFPITNLVLERIPHYELGSTFSDHNDGLLKLSYSKLDFLFLQFVGSGGSGEVYLVEDQETHKLKIVKRFFDEAPIKFMKENYIMNKMEYPISWHHEDSPFFSSTLAEYQFKGSTILRNLKINSSIEYARVFYKICQQLGRAHKKGIIHQDIKRGNILVNQYDRQFDVQLIDWSLASLYYPGFQLDNGQGTQCYLSPQELVLTNFVTPATDIWSLAIVYFYFMAGHKPYSISCAKDNLAAILTNSSAQKFLKFLRKYRMNPEAIEQIMSKVQRYPQIHEGTPLRDKIPEDKRYLFNQELIDLFEKMLEIDPETRISISQILHHPYFDIIKNLPEMHEIEQKKSINVQKASADNLREVFPPNLLKDT